MSNCPNTGLTVPECSCTRCIERQLEQFAPDRAALRRFVHDPLLLQEVRPSPTSPPSVSERLRRPAL
ncbi:MAG: hypothetical protein ACXWZM_03535 [Solirubrobacterales bacterium]